MVKGISYQTVNMRQMFQSVAGSSYAFRFDIPIYLINGLSDCKIEKIAVMKDTIILEGFIHSYPYYTQSREQCQFQHQPLHSSLDSGYPLLQTEDPQKRLQ